MEKYIKALFDLTKLPTKFFLLLAFVSGFILFFDQKLLDDKMFLNGLKAQYGWIVGLVFIISLSFSVLNFFIWIINSIINWFARKTRVNYVKTKVAKLDAFEQSVLREFVLQGKKSIEMPIDNETVSGLISQGILVKNTQIGGSFIMNGMNVSLCINRLVEKVMLVEHLGLSDPPTDEQILFAKQNRPPWIREGYY
ncbi:MULTISPECIES: super-infection exclusion protein B [unclassified Sphingobacterium]|uniref:super-infection exclusion protein B n=1 Tax=unclassified Sphingobacterium TaxID=2609468 RepID=UPI0025FD13E8|nr:MULTISPECIES: super-infection exclusion protein B [unclassified Sphingobacterium]